MSFIRTFAICLLLTCAAPVLCRADVIEDPIFGFEDITPRGDLRFWKVPPQYPLAVELVGRDKDPQGVHGGSHAVKLVQKDKDKSGHLYCEIPFPVESSATYTVSFWARGEGSISLMLYLYQLKDGNEAFHSSTGIENVAGAAASQLKPGADWRKLEFRISGDKLDPKVRSARLVLVPAGSVYVDDCTILKQGGSEAPVKLNVPGRQKDAGAADDVVRPNLLSIRTCSKPPRIDGRIDTDEYPTQWSGLLDTSTKALYGYPSDVYFAQDPERLYMAIRLQLPDGYNLKMSANARDSAGLTAAADTFYLMLRGDANPAAKAYEGAYLAVSARGDLFDAWEKVDWVKSTCTRDAAFNTNTKVVTRLKDRAWTLELSVPWKDLRLDPPTAGKALLASFGMNLQNTSLAWQLFSNWFDHYQGFGQLCLADPDATAVSAGSLAELSKGRISPRFDLANTASRPSSYELTYLISTPKLVGGGVGSWIFDVAIDARQKDVIRDKAVHFWQQSGSLESGKSTQEQEAPASLEEPGYYVLEIEARLNGKAALYQKIPFNYWPPVTAELTPLPSKEQIEAEISLLGAADDQRGKLSISFKDSAGKQVLAQDVPATQGKMTVPISMKDLAPGDYQVAVVLSDKAGKEVGRADVPFKKWETPEWLKDRKGLEALDGDWSPQPWTGVQVQQDQRRVWVWGRTFDFARDSLISAISSQDRPLLAGGIKIKCLIGGREHTFTIADPKFASIRKGRVEITQDGSAPGFALSAKQRIEFDGMDLVELNLANKGRVNVDQLWVEVPFNEMTYSAFMSLEGSRREFWQHGLASDAEFAQPRRYHYVWLGDDDVGCAFFAENYKGWVINSTKPRVTLTSDAAGRRTLKLLLVNEPSEIDAPIHVVFGFHPTPYKPRFEGWNDVRPDNDQSTIGTNVYTAHASQWNSGDSKPSPRSWEMFNDLIAWARSHGQKVNPYIGSFYVTPWDYIKRDVPFTTRRDGYPKEWLWRTKKDATRLEEYFYFQKEWNLNPPNVVPTSDFETREEVFTTPSGSYADFFVGSVYDMLTKSDFDGFFLDISCPKINSDPAKGLSYKTKDGVEEGTFESLATRDFYKRLYWLFDKYRGQARKPWLIGHNFPIALPYCTLWDMTVNGEEIKQSKPFELTDFALQKSLRGNPAAIPSTSPSDKSYDAYGWRSIFGRQFGLAHIFLPQYGYNPELRTEAHAREVLSFTVLHNNRLWPAYIPPSVVFQFWAKVEVPFGMADTEFHPYWKNGIKPDQECIKVSYWKKNKGRDYLVAVANWSDQDVTANIPLPEELRSLESGVDLESGQRLPLGGNWAVPVPAHNLRAFRLGLPSSSQ